MSGEAVRLSRRRLLGAGAVAGLGLLRPSFADWLGEGGSAASALYDRALVIDGCGGPGDLVEGGGAPLAPATVDAIAASGVTAVNLTIGGVGSMPSAEAFERIVRDLAAWSRAAELLPQRLLTARRFEDLAVAKASGRLAILFGLQDGVAFEDDLSRLDTLRNLGVRIVQPTYNLRNLLGDGCLEEADAGLSRAGHAAVERMNALGVLIDLSHCGRRTTAETIAVSAKPVAFTHAGCFALNPHPRNKSDEALRALADRGGVAGIYFMPYLRATGQQQAADVVAHLEHAIDVAGEDHVAIGTDGQLPGVALTPEFLKAHAEDVAARRRAGIGAPRRERRRLHLRARPQHAPAARNPRRPAAGTRALVGAGREDPRRQLRARAARSLELIPVSSTSNDGTFARHAPRPLRDHRQAGRGRHG